MPRACATARPRRSVTIVGSSVAFGYANSHEWSIAVADSASDMLTRSGSYRVVVPTQTAVGLGLPDPLLRWDVADLGELVTAQVVRLEVEKFGGDDIVHLSEWQLDFANSPCDSGADLSRGPDNSIAVDIDGQWRVAPWDVGADEAAISRRMSVRSSRGAKLSAKH